MKLNGVGSMYSNFLGVNDIVHCIKKHFIMYNKFTDLKLNLGRKLGRTTGNLILLFKCFKHKNYSLLPL